MNASKDWKATQEKIQLNLPMERHLQTGCEQQSTTGFLQNRARRTERLFITMMFRVFREQFQME